MRQQIKWMVVSGLLTCALLVGAASPFGGSNTLQASLLRAELEKALQAEMNQFHQILKQGKAPKKDKKLKILRKKVNRLVRETGKAEKKERRAQRKAKREKIAAAKPKFHLFRRRKPAVQPITKRIPESTATRQAKQAEVQRIQQEKARRLREAHARKAYEQEQRRKQIEAAAARRQLKAERAREKVAADRVQSVRAPQVKVETTVSVKPVKPAQKGFFKRLFHWPVFAGSKAKSKKVVAKRPSSGSWRDWFRRFSRKTGKKGAYSAKDKTRLERRLAQAEKRHAKNQASAQQALDAIHAEEETIQNLQNQRVELNDQARVFSRHAARAHTGAERLQAMDAMFDCERQVKAIDKKIAREQKKRGKFIKRAASWQRQVEKSNAVVNRLKTQLAE